jgi:hypothetical protein
VLIVLADNLDLEELETREGEHCVRDDTNANNTDGWVDEQEEMLETEQNKLETDIQPV